MYDSDSTAHLEYYRPSGSASPVSVILTLCASVLAGAVLSAIYAFANYHNPFIYLNILLLYGLAFALGWLTSWGVRRFHIRNAFAAAAIGVIAFVVSYAVHWLFYISTVIVYLEADFSYDVPEIIRLATELMRDPDGAWEWIKAINEEGIWSIGSSSGSDLEFKGLLLTAVWLAEAAVLLYYSVKKPWDEAGKPYSERSGEWIEGRELPLGIAFVEDSEKFKKDVSRGDCGALVTPLPESDDEPLKFAKVVLYADQFTPYVTVKNVTVKKKKKKSSVSEKVVVRYLKITPSTAGEVSDALAGGDRSDGA